MSLIKLAVAKWRTFLNAATSNHDLQNRVGKLLVGSQAPKTFGKAAKGYAGFTANVTTQPLSKDLLDQSKRFVQGGFSRVNTELNPLHSAITKRGLGQKVAPITGPKRGMASSLVQKPIGGEEWHDIAHGGDFHSLKARLQGNAPYPMQAPAQIGNKIQTNGMQVIKQNSDMSTLNVTHGYAHSAAENKGTIPGVLTGRIQGKYLFANPTVKGEFAIPHEYMNKITNGNVNKI